MLLYTVTDWLALVPLAVVCSFALLGVCQWVRRKRLRLVDRNVLVLGVFYLVVMAVFLLFEIFAINYRPVLIDGVLEASYPSSTTMLVACVMPTALMQLRTHVRSRLLLRCMRGLTAAFVAFMIAARLLSGVHWLTDIIGAGLISTGLVLLYRALTER
jgi:undecaprenyl-diphosphatase